MSPRIFGVVALSGSRRSTDLLIFASGGPPNSGLGAKDRSGPLADFLEKPQSPATVGTTFAGFMFLAGDPGPVQRSSCNSLVACPACPGCAANGVQLRLDRPTPCHSLNTTPIGQDREAQQLMDSSTAIHRIRFERSSTGLPFSVNFRPFSITARGIAP